MILKTRVHGDIEINAGRDSYVYTELMQEDFLVLEFTTNALLELKLGDSVVFGDKVFYLQEPEQVEMINVQEYDYKLKMYANREAELYMFKNIADQTIQFSYTATARAHLQLLVDNLNLRGDGGWSIGDCIETSDKAITYDKVNCYNALRKMSEEFKTEFEIINKVISLKTIEYNKDNPVSLGYGKGKGLLSGVTRLGQGNNAISRLYVQGGERNIDKKAYGTSTLHLPKNAEIKYNGVEFGQEGDTYRTDAKGEYITRVSNEEENFKYEASYENTDVYPKRVGTVSQVRKLKENIYNFNDNSIPEDLNYKNYLIKGGESMAVVFQTGQLAGRTFELSNYKHKSREFEIVPIGEIGLNLPNDDLQPKAGDKYIIINVSVPEIYITDKNEGAEWELFREAVKYFYANQAPKISYKGEIDPIFVRDNSEQLQGRLNIGSYVRFSDNRIINVEVLLRIISKKIYLNDPLTPTIELSNNPVSVASTLSYKLEKAKTQEVIQKQLHKEGRAYARRQFAQAEQTVNALLDSKIGGFSDKIKPITMQTMQLLVGSPALQFRFIRSKTDFSSVAVAFSWQRGHDFVINSSYLMHQTIGLSNDFKPVNDSDRKVWTIAEYRENAMIEDSSIYYLYAVVEKSGENGVFLLTKESKEFEDTKHYNLLVGYFNTVNADEQRDFVTLYGYSEVLPGQIRTGKIISNDGSTYFDLENNEIGGNIKFSIGGKDPEELIRELQDTANNAPIIKNGTWWTWDKVRHTYVNTNVRAQGQNGQNGRNGRDGKNAEFNNLVLNSNFAKGFENWHPKSYFDTVEEDAEKGFVLTRNGTHGGWTELHNQINLTVGTYTLSYDIRINDINLYKGWIICRAYNTSGKSLFNSPYAPPKSTTEWQRMSYTFKMPEAGYVKIGVTQTSTFNFSVTNFKLERGEEPTPWTPHVTELKGQDIDASEFDYLRHALQKGTTDIAGGLLLSNIVGVKNAQDKVEAYLSGTSPYTLATGVEGFGTENETAGVYIKKDGSAKIGRMYFDRIGNKDANTLAVVDDNNRSRIQLSINNINALEELKKTNGTTSTANLSVYKTTETEGTIKTDKYIRVTQENQDITGNLSVDMFIEGNEKDIYLSLTIELWKNDNRIYTIFNDYISSAYSIVVAKSHIYYAKDGELKINRDLLIQGIEVGTYRVVYRVNKSGFVNPTMHVNFNLNLKTEYYVDNRALLIGQNGISAFFNRNKYFQVENSTSAKSLLNVKGGAEIDTINGYTPQTYLWQGLVDYKLKKIKSTGFLRQFGSGYFEQIEEGIFKLFFPKRLDNTNYAVQTTGETQNEWGLYITVTEKQRDYFIVRIFSGSYRANDNFIFTVVSTEDWRE